MTAPTACLGTPGHSWQQTAQAGSRLAHKGLLQAGKAMALAAVKAVSYTHLSPRWRRCRG